MTTLLLNADLLFLKQYPMVLATQPLPDSDPLQTNGFFRLTVSDDALPLLAQSGTLAVREALAYNNRLNTALALILADDADDRVLYALARNPRTPLVALENLTHNPHASQQTLQAVRHHRHCSQTLYDTLTHQLQATDPTAAS
ncbi:hypothetical protein SAMN00768000_3596 [Sulfobacillus thermosulfidooxidans DSM 9293]|uniref:DUF4116 domain-containing protein n=2 Tax=Sulfobacillus thermosulfidooxidans TaxID=28034 RepID=A0A1W1WP58_SULTA|nr:hypothetical protein [Sulfobacillus thermosulfidooxidans]PSR21994.1 MAG: hypothetical protein C7B47_16975 [Sulfobacillus thermosulfidooxidans]SMC08016.1 hypothetical protein SAMN00768000_3596 [Sulfobacillus thermosulfidooxidans DSM 9293]